MMLKRWAHPAALLLAVLFCLSSCSKAEKEKNNAEFTVPEYYYHPEWLSDDLDERFQQQFYYALDNPTVETPFPPDSDPNDTIPSGNGTDSCLFKSFYFFEQVLIEGSFFLIEPPYSVVGVGLDRYVLRGIYDLKGSEREKDGHFHLQSFSMQVELGECQLSDLKLSHRDLFRLKNQNIPLTTEEKDGILTITANFDQVPPIEVSDLQSSLTLTATVTYQGETYSMEGRI